jgi:alpha-ketoglutarate-dependent taurine dioxygenase
VAATSSVYETEYEAFFNLIAVEDPGAHGGTAYVTVVWCLDDACVADDCDWSVTRPQYQDARLAGLAHCRERHVRGPWR